jgi:hypothetical protein
MSRSWRTRGEGQEACRRRRHPGTPLVTNRHLRRQRPRPHQCSRAVDSTTTQHRATHVSTRKHMQAKGAHPVSLLHTHMPPYLSLLLVRQRDRNHVRLGGGAAPSRGQWVRAKNQFQTTGCSLSKQAPSGFESKGFGLLQSTHGSSTSASQTRKHVRLEDIHVHLEQKHTHTPRPQHI